MTALFVEGGGATPCDLVWWGWWGLVSNFSWWTGLAALRAGSRLHIVQLGPVALVTGLSQFLHYVQLGPSALGGGLALGAGSQFSTPFSGVAWLHSVQLGPAALVTGLAQVLHCVQLGPSALVDGLAHQMGGLWVYILIIGLKLGVKLDWICTWQQATL